MLASGHQFKQLGLDHQGAITLARKLHAHSVKYANKLATTRRGIESNDTSQSRSWSRVHPVTLQVLNGTFCPSLGVEHFSAWSGYRPRCFHSAALVGGYCDGTSPFLQTRCAVVSNLCSLARALQGCLLD
eukprot:1142487-Pelagomonas_calceolata.AAC.1